MADTPLSSAARPAWQDLHDALRDGDLQQVQALVAAGADLHYRREGGYDALLDAVHGCDDTRLIELLQWLIAQGAPLNGVSSHNESGVRVLSRLARFDAVRLLLEAGADPAPLAWTPLLKAAALGSAADVEALVRGGAPLEERDSWSRTAWLLALQSGDVAKAQVLRALGAHIAARGRCGKPPLFHAIDSGSIDMLRWLLHLGAGIEDTDDFGDTPLMHAVESVRPDVVDVLLAAGARIDRENNHGGTALSAAASSELAVRLLDAAANPAHLSQEGRRALLGLPPDANATLLAAAGSADFVRARTRRFGRHNPEAMDEPFWQCMVRAGVNGYAATQWFQGPSSFDSGPVWCAQRFGQSLTRLPDGRIVQIGGEHEDYYDPDFCIYNDVFVHHPDGSLRILGYREAVFPPTDFHTATLMDGAIYVIGSLGYSGQRRYGHTPVYRLDVGTFAFQRLEPAGEAPGWVHEHRAVKVSGHEIRVSGGKLATLVGDKEVHTANTREFVLDVQRLAWHPVSTT
jgi:ankyrin repeat protein